MKKLGKMYAKVGFPDNGDSADGVRIAQYAYWNENGVLASKRGVAPTKHGDGIWVTPQRPFMSQAVDNNSEQITQTGKKIVKQVSEGKIDAKTAMRLNAENMVNLIKTSIKTGRFAPNSDITIKGIKGFIKGKETSKPLINTGMMRNSVMYQIFEGDNRIEQGGKKPG